MLTLTGELCEGGDDIVTDKAPVRGEKLHKATIYEIERIDLADGPPVAIAADFVIVRQSASPDDDYSAGVAALEAAGKLACKCCGWKSAPDPA